MEAAAGLRDATALLQGRAYAAQEAAGDDPISPPTPAEIPDHNHRIRDAFRTWSETADLADLEGARETANPATVLDLTEALQQRRR